MIIVERYFGEEEDKEYLDELESWKSNAHRWKPIMSATGGMIGASLGSKFKNHKTAGAILGSGVGSIGGYYAGKKLQKRAIKGIEKDQEEYRNSSEEKKYRLRNFEE